MEPTLGLRVVRGPDWRWEDQDGGEGCVGTVAELGREKKAVVVQWDCGTRAMYRSGVEDKFDLRVLDTAPTGLKFPEVVCSGCYSEGVAGTYWKCGHCYEYHLCHSCYLLGRHCQEHPFFRVQSTEQTPRVMVSPRVSASRVEAKGIFPGAKVARGRNWKFGDQDGGAGSVGKVSAVKGWENLSARSVAEVKWSASRHTNIYRVGHRGKVDLNCVSVGSGGHYYPEHLCPLGCGALVSIFDENEIVAGDVITVSLEPDIFKMMQEAIGHWNSSMLELLGCSGVVLSVMEHQRLFTIFDVMLYSLCSSAVTKLKHCRQGETVRVTSDLSLLHQLQSQRGIWDDGLTATLGQIGRVTKVSTYNIIKVIVQGKEWLYRPLCLSPAPGESAPEDIDPKNRNLGMSIILSKKKARDQLMEEGITDVALLDGDPNSLRALVYSNRTEQMLKEKLLAYYAVTGMIPALKMVLESGVDPNILHHGVPLIDSVIECNQKEACLTLMNAGADISGISYLREFTAALVLESCLLLKAIVTYSGLTLDIDALRDDGYTALNFAVNLSNHLDVAILLGVGASPTAGIRNPICGAGVYGLVSVMETFVVHAKEYLNVRDPDTGCAAIHLAAGDDHSRVCSILAAQDCVDIDLKGSDMTTALHSAALKARWGAVECLVGWGAQLNAADIKGGTPLHVIVEGKSPVVPDSEQLKMVHEELSGALRASGGGAVEGYVTVACFLVQEGADFHIKNKDGVSPYQMMLPEMASLITAYVKNHPGSFHGSLRSTQQSLLCELPQQLRLSSGTGPTARAAQAIGPSVDRKTLAGFLSTTKQEDRFVNVKKPQKGTDELLSVKQQPPTSSSGGGSQQYQASADPTVQSPENLSPDSQGQLCLLCEEHPASVQFSPCGHTVMCSGCAKRAKRCYDCQTPVTAKTQLE